MPDHINSRPTDNINSHDRKSIGITTSSVNNEHVNITNHEYYELQSCSVGAAAVSTTANILSSSFKYIPLESENLASPVPVVNIFSGSSLQWRYLLLLRFVYNVLWKILHPYAHMLFFVIKLLFLLPIVFISSFLCPVRLGRIAKWWREKFLVCQFS